MTYQRRLALQAEYREFMAYMGCTFACCLALAVFLFLGASPDFLGREELDHPTAVLCTFGAAASIAAAMWFLIEAPRAARNAYLAVLFQR